MLLEFIALILCLMLVSRVLGRSAQDAAPAAVAAGPTPTATAANVGDLARRRARFSHRGYTRGDGFTLSGPRVG